MNFRLFNSARLISTKLRKPLSGTNWEKVLTLEPVHGKMEGSFRNMTGRMLRVRGGNLYEGIGLGEDAAVAADPL